MTRLDLIGQDLHPTLEQLQTRERRRAKLATLGILLVPLGVMVGTVFFFVNN